MRRKPLALTCNALQSIHVKGIEVAASNQKPVGEERYILVTPQTQYQCGLGGKPATRAWAYALQQEIRVS